MQSEMHSEEFERSLCKLPPRKRFKVLEKQRMEQEQRERWQRQKQSTKAKPLELMLLQEMEEDKENSGVGGNMSQPPEELVAKKSGITSRISAPAELLPKKVEEEEEEDGVECNVCRSGDADPSDPIVFCDGCDVRVHASCYGYPLSQGVPQGDWFCCHCQSQQAGEKCCLCPCATGALKRTTDGRWAHISCALFVPEVFFVCAEGREPVDCSSVPGKRWHMLCSVCSTRDGACVQCAEAGCKHTFHVSCGLDREFSLEYHASQGGGLVIAFCEKHTPAWRQHQRKLRRSFHIVPRERIDSNLRKGFRIVPRNASKPKKMTKTGPTAENCHKANANQLFN